MSYSGQCHCGQVSFDVEGEPERLLECNCSICARYATLWVYSPPNVITLRGIDQTSRYVWGDKTLGFHFCKNCGVVVAWISLTNDRFAVNFRLIDAQKRAHIPIWLFDGADSFEFLATPKTNESAPD